MRASPGAKRDVGEARAVRLLPPVVDDQLAVETEAIAVVAFDADASRRRRGGTVSLPVQRTEYQSNGMPRAGEFERPAEIDCARRCATSARLAGRGVVVEVLAAQAARRLRPARSTTAASLERRRIARDAARPGRVAHARRRADARANAVENRHLGDCRARCSRRAAPRSASAPMTAIERVARTRAAARPRSFLSSTIDCARRLARQRAMSTHAVPVRGAVGIDVRLLEQPELELGAQHARHRASMTESAIRPRWNASRYGRCCCRTTTGR